MMRSLGAKDEVEPENRLRDNRSYYDAFSNTYEAGRDAGYHALVDSMTAELLGRYTAGKDLLEVGCGTGLILKEVAEEARTNRKTLFLVEQSR